MRSRMQSASVVLIGAVLFIAVRASAFPEYARQSKAACAACHVNPAGGPELTGAGRIWKSSKKPVLPATALAIKGPEYVGPERCAACHPAQHESWKGTRHADAFHELRDPDPEMASVFEAAAHVELQGRSPAETDACVVCHVTGFKLPGGYPAADSAKNARLVNVTCENCHGPGGRHVTARLSEKKKTIDRGVTANLCVQCHTQAIAPEFDFEKAKAIGTHELAAK